MIKHKPKTARGFLRYHRILWNAIIRALKLIIKNGGSSTLVESCAEDFKRSIFAETFSFKLSPTSCFPCNWSLLIDHRCDCNLTCLLECNNKSADYDKCLDGTYMKFVENYEDDNFEMAIHYAEIIRDIPMQEQWRERKNDP